MRARKLIAPLAAAAVCAVAPAAAIAADTSDVAVCNEAEFSWHGGYTVTDPTDPNPPAFLRGSQMRLGNGHGAGLVNAAEHSPALAVCTPDDGDGGGGDGGGGGVT